MTNATRSDRYKLESLVLPQLDNTLSRYDAGPSSFPAFLFLHQIGYGVLHFVQVNVGARIVRHVRNPPVLPDEEADAAGHVFVGHSGAILVGNLPVGVHEQGEVEAV